MPAIVPSLDTAQKLSQWSDSLVFIYFFKWLFWRFSYPDWFFDTDF